MTDYTERVNALREHADLIETSIELYGPSATRLLVYDLRNAAAAIEELQAVLKEADKKQEYQHGCICELTAENEELKDEVKRLKMHCADCEYGNSPWPEEPVHEPKRGEWILKERAHYFKCSICKEPIPYKFGYGGNRYYNYCPRCGAKMEVQDIKSVTMREGDTDADGFFRKAFEAVMEVQE